MQKFKRNDLVIIDEDLGPSMLHFQGGCEAIVIGSYADQYGGDDTKSYTLYLEGSGEVSWYKEHQLTLIKENQEKLLELWQEEEKQEREQKADIDWIFINGKDVLNHSHGASIKTLAKHLGITNLWGSRGEGFVYVQNAALVLKIAEPYLQTNDKAGWLKFSKNLQENA